MSLCGMCSDLQYSAPVLVLTNYRNKNCDMHSVQRVGCTIESDSFPFYILHVSMDARYMYT